MAVKFGLFFPLFGELAEPSPSSNWDGQPKGQAGTGCSSGTISWPSPGWPWLTLG